MSAVFYLLATVAILGAFDTLYYHEWRARLVTRPFVRCELLLHAARDFVYAILFGALPWVEFHGVFAYLLGVLLVVEIAITLADFIVEDDVRKPLGGVYPGERATHALIGIVYGAMLGYLAPILAEWSFLPSDLSLSHATSPLVRVFFVVTGVGVILSGVRDLLAAWTHSRVGGKRRLRLRDGLTFRVRCLAR